jgi:dephospho-CoA kinase
MMTIGVTGEIGAGKTTLARLFEEWGAELVSGDRIGWELLEPGEPIHRELVERYGDEILRDGGEIDREKLGKAVFSSSHQLKEFNTIVHPELLRRLRKRMEAAGRRSTIVVVDAALIVEWQIEGEFDKLIVVIADEKERISRLRDSGRLSDEDVRNRSAAQLDRAEKVKRADWVVENSGTADELRAKAQKIWAEVTEGTEKHS